MDQLKRKPDDLFNVQKRLKKENCPHAEKCYRQNPHHFREYVHPHLIRLLSDEGNGIKIPDNFPQDKKVYLQQLEIMKSVTTPINTTENYPGTSTKTSTINPIERVESTAKPGTMLAKLQNAHPYNLFFTTIPKSKMTSKHSNAITFQDLLCPSLGVLKNSLQINFMIDAMWLMEQYKAKNVADKPLTILYGDEFPKMPEYLDKFHPNITHKLIRMKDPFGCHHSKISIFQYNDHSIRVIVSTANLYYEDWNHYNQELWISPKLQRLPDGDKDGKGESPTGFKSELLKYLKTYNLSCLQEWIRMVSEADFSDVRVFLVTSTPGKHYPSDNNGSHLYCMKNLLMKYYQCTPNDDKLTDWTVIAQASSLGSFGKSVNDWLKNVLLRHLSGYNNGTKQSTPNMKLHIIFPTVSNVLNGLFGAESGGCLPYFKKTHEKQLWLHDYLFQWKADLLHRTRAMPHLKTYCRLSPCLQKLGWFLLTSANISKAAWGGNVQKDFSIYVRSYEAGVLFLPKFFDQQHLKIVQNTTTGDNQKIFPFIYDLPLTPYGKDDYPYCN